MLSPQFSALIYFRHNNKLFFKKKGLHLNSCSYQFLSQNQFFLNKNCLCFESHLFHVQKPQNSTSLTNYFPKPFAAHLETSHGTQVEKHWNNVQ